MAMRIRRGEKRGARPISVLIAGILVGLCVGFLVMDTVHAMLEIGASQRQKSKNSHSSKIHLQSPSAHQSTSTTDQHPHHHSRNKSKAKHKEMTSRFPTTGDKVHVLITSGGSPYQNFQTRIMYGTFKMAQKLPGGEKLVAFTRILHRVNPDRLMHEIPTFHAKPLQPECDNWCEFPPASRPNAVRQFFDAALKTPSMIKAPWLLMTEPDYVWIRPVQAPMAEDSHAPAVGFEYGYIDPQHPNAESVLKRFYPGKMTDIPRTGPAPMLMRVGDWLGVTPFWESITAQIEADAEAKEKLGWVREMYAFSVAMALKNVSVKLPLVPANPLMIQPPADHKIGMAAMMHYTWAPIITDRFDNPVFKFEKREYTEEKHEILPPKLQEVPPFDPDAGWKLQDNVEVTEEMRDTLDLMITTMNNAIGRMKALN